MVRQDQMPDVGLAGHLGANLPRAVPPVPVRRILVRPVLRIEDQEISLAAELDKSGSNTGFLVLYVGGDHDVGVAGPDAEGEALLGMGHAEPGDLGPVE